MSVDTLLRQSFFVIYSISHRKYTTSSSWNDFRDWVKRTNRKYPQSLLENTIGLTYEKKHLSVLKVSKGGNNPIVFILGGEEGRDWMSPAIILKFINSILEDKLEELTNYYDFHFLPLFNPDGNTFSKTKERFWSKNRKQFYSKKLCSDDTLALGVNIDRNWFEDTHGFHQWECGNIYPGDSPLSEEETKGLSDYLDRIAPRTIAFFNIRGFDQLITLPYAKTGKFSNNHNTIMEIFNFACDQLTQKYNVTYFLGTTSNFFYNLSGNCADWVKKNLNVPVVATIYMKDEANIILDDPDITLQYEQFETLMMEVLSLTKDLYGPLFNTQMPHSSHIATLWIAITCFILSLY